MTQFLKATVNVDDQPGGDFEVRLPVGISESQALVVLEGQVPGLYRDQLIAERLDNAIRYFRSRPDLAERLMRFARRRDGLSLLHCHLTPFRKPYDMDDPVALKSIEVGEQ